MKHVFFSFLTASSILLINWGVVTVLDAAFIEYAFLTGVISTAIVRFFSSTGGFSSNSARVSIQAQTGIKIDEEEQRFNPTVVFYTALSYTIIALITTAVYYKDYFM
ncbi:hypothetical protein FZW96_12625 [Bacillus sp. BGMRC 2118]|nr:hypothetical protein FZW96_12625 [Bacillus sp. BGMRC 2118]